MTSIDRRLGDAVKHFWMTRRGQETRQGSRTGQRDYGGRAAVTGGAQMDGFVNTVAELLVENGIPETSIFRKRNVQLPGFFRPTKEWDLLVIVEDQLLASVEFKSQVGPSFGNNYNNRIEEALGSATDLWTAYREGVFKPSPRPWLGYFMLLESAPGSRRTVRVREPHFPVRDEFRNASYAKRYEILCERLVRERLYDGACLILSERSQGIKGGYEEPSAELSFVNFASSLIGRAVALSAREALQDGR